MEHDAKQPGTEHGIHLPAPTSSPFVCAFGVTLMVLSNVLVGGALALAAPVLALVFRGRADKQVKERAKEEAPKVVIDAAKKMADAFDERIDEFGERLIDFVTRANEEMSRSIAELVRTAREAKSSGAAAQTKLAGDVGMTLARLEEVETRMQGMRTGLWASGLRWHAQHPGRGQRKTSERETAARMSMILLTWSKPTSCPMKIAATSWRR